MTISGTSSSHPLKGGGNRRWWVLATLGLAQLMVVLDATIVNVALPDAQADLGFAPEDRQWMVTAYALAFGSLLLLGGRLSDRWGQRTTLLVGLLGFAVASTVGGAASTFGMLIAARAAQGAFAAILAPAALSLLTVTFTEPSERSRAFGVFGAVSGAGAAVGLILGGVLTEYMDWSWCLYVNDFFAVAAALGTLVVIPHREAVDRVPLDLPGTIFASAGLLALVYGFARAERDGWTGATPLGLIAAGVLLLGVFALLERRVAHPLLPLRILADRARGGALVSLGLSNIGIFAVFLFLTFFLQENLGLSPLATGVAFLPIVVGITFASTAVAPQMLTRRGPRRPIVIGALLGAIALGWLSTLSIDSSYLTHVLPAALVVGLGLGMIFGSAAATATDDVRSEDAGVASALVNTFQQVGGALGTALLTTLAAQTTAGLLAGGAASQTAAVAGYGRAFLVAAGVFVVMALVCGMLLVRSGRSRPTPRNRSLDRATQPINGTHQFRGLRVSEPIDIVRVMAQNGAVTTAASEGVVVPVRRGRKRDHSRDGAILDAATDVLGEVGYANLTMDMVALRAKAGKATVYRRWASKEELVRDVVNRLKHSQVDLESLPDTGTLRGDLLALFRPQSVEDDERRNKALAGLASMLSHHTVFAEAANDALVKPWADAYLVLMKRAVDRGEIPASADIETIGQVVPTMAAYRALVQRKPFDRDFLVASIDVIVLPALQNTSITTMPAS
jgi:EmrB/QacA subfamily drug resistance transporter